MLNSFFSVDYQDRGDLFEGLAIWEEEKYRQLQGTYPVINLSFARIKETDYKKTKAKIYEVLRNEYIKYYYVRNSDAINWSFIPEQLSKYGFDPYMHYQFLQKFFVGELPCSFARGENSVSEPSSGKSKSFGTTSSLCGFEKASLENDEKEFELAVKRISLLYAFVMSLPGVPVLCSGDELGLLNDYSKENSSTKFDLHSVKFDWEKAQNVSRPSHKECKIYRGIKKPLSLRKANKLFNSDVDIKLYDVKDKSIICFTKSDGGNKKLLCVFNFSSEDKIVRTGRNLGINLKTKKEEKLRRISLPAFEYKFFEFVK